MYNYFLDITKAACYNAPVTVRMGIRDFSPYPNIPIPIKIVSGGHCPTYPNCDKSDRWQWPLRFSGANMADTAFLCRQCGCKIKAKNEMAYKLLASGSITLCDACRRSGPVQHWTKETYRDYLQSPQWKTRRKLALRFAGNRCQICNSNGRLHVHHNTYERLGRELDRDLLVVCEAHHRMIHDIN